MDTKDLLIRSLVALICIPVIFGAAIIGELVFLALIDIIVLIELLEFYAMQKHKGLQPLAIPGVLWVMAASVDLYMYSASHIVPILAGFAGVSMMYGLFFRRQQRAINVAVTILGALYTSLLFFMILLRQLPEQAGLSSHTGAHLIIVVFSVIWACDTAAYIFGSMYGKTPLAPQVSPKKTVEGFFAGLAGGMLVTILLGTWLLPEFSILTYCMIGLIIGTVGQVSDLLESMFKRDAGVKDSSHILPGHGGILDRFDNPILSVPVLYAYMYLLLR